MDLALSEPVEVDFSKGIDFLITGGARTKSQGFLDTGLYQGFKFYVNEDGRLTLQINTRYGRGGDDAALAILEALRVLGRGGNAIVINFAGIAIDVVDPDLEQRLIERYPEKAGTDGWDPNSSLIELVNE